MDGSTLWIVGDLELVSEAVVRVRDLVVTTEGCRRRAQLDHSMVVLKLKGHVAEEAVLPSTCS